MTTDKLPWKA